MAEYTSRDIENALDDRGELLLQLESDGPDSLELHLHDTTFFHDASDSGEIVVNCTDGEYSFRATSIEALAIHTQSLADLGF
jgi:hypothetical protein